MSNRIVNHDIAPMAFGLAALTLAFSAMSAHPESLAESARPITLAQAGQTGTSTPAIGTQGTTSGSSTPATTSSATAPSGAKTGAAAAAPTRLSFADRRMLQQYAAANLAEIDMAKLAESKSENEQVKTYARRMMDDHTSALNELTQLARTKGVDLPSTPDARHQATIKKLSSLSGSAFDKQYLAQGGASDHRRVHDLLMRMSKTARDADLKAMAIKTLPTINEHLKLAQTTQSGTASTSSGK